VKKIKKNYNFYKIYIFREKWENKSLTFFELFLIFWDFLTFFWDFFEVFWRKIELFSEKLNFFRRKLGKIEENWEKLRFFRRKCHFFQENCTFLQKNCTFLELFHGLCTTYIGIYRLTRALWPYMWATHGSVCDHTVALHTSGHLVAIVSQCETTVSLYWATVQPHKPLGTSTSRLGWYMLAHLWTKATVYMSSGR